MKKFLSLFLTITILASFVIGCGDKKKGDLITDIAPSATATQNEITSKEDPEDENSGQIPASTDGPDVTEDTGVTVKPSPTDSVVDPQKTDKKVNTDNVNSATDFAVKLLKQSVNPTKSDENTLISPFSVIAALSMITNGAETETLKQLEQTLGLSKDELNQFIYAYTNSLPESEKYKLSVANSIWINQYRNFDMNVDFEKANQMYYDAEIFTEPFNEDTVNKVNEWVKNNTDGMIPKIIDDVSDTDVMYLLNALAFDAEWQTPYDSWSVWDGVFTCENGTEVGVEFMKGNEGTYLEDSNATGFIKYYKDSSYAFVALLPNEGVSVSQYIQSLSGEHLRNIISLASHESVYTIMPKFTVDYSADISDMLTALGIQNAFDSFKADFSGAGKSEGGNLYIDKVIHNTHIEVAENGTRGGAATGIIAPDSAPRDPKAVRLNRPFVYMIIDSENNLPVFMGTMRDML